MKAPYKGRQAWGLWNRQFLTNLNARLAMPWTRLFILLGLSPNAVTALSFAVSLAGMFLVAYDPTERDLYWLGGVLLMVGLLWDHSDGQVARLTGRSSTGGALLDTVLDRWVEAGWIAALAAGPFLGYPRQVTFHLPLWSVVLIGCWAVHATLYVRWSNVQRDLYRVRAELRRAKDAAPDPSATLIDLSRLPARKPMHRTLMVPIAFNRDSTMWVLFAITLVPFWVVGLALFALLHTLTGLERNWYTYRELQRTDTTATRWLLDPDYHK